MNKEAIVSLKNIGKSFGSTRALESVSFDFSKGDITAIVGANGAGKSTLIKIICGYHTKYDGCGKFGIERFANQQKKFFNKEKELY